MLATPGLQLRGVWYSHRGGQGGAPALTDVSLEVRQGEVVALLGSNGAGKSTLMSVAAGLLEPDQGEVRILGEPLSGRGPTRRLVGLASQEDAVYPVLSVRKNLEFFGQLAGLSKGQLDRRVAEVADSLGLRGALDALASRLSGGQRRRLHAALTLMHDPAVLLLDELSIGIDQGSRERLLELVLQMADRGSAVLYSTHQLAEVEQLATRVVVIDQGRVIAGGTVDDLVRTYAPPLVELTFRTNQFELPPTIVSALDSATVTADGTFHVIARIRTCDVSIDEVIVELDSSIRGELLSASVRRPDLDTAYRRIVRFHGSTAHSHAQAVGP